MSQIFSHKKLSDNFTAFKVKILGSFLSRCAGKQGSFLSRCAGKQGSFLSRCAGELLEQVCRGEYSGLQSDEVQRNRFVCVAAPLRVPLHKPRKNAIAAAKMAAATQTGAILLYQDEESNSLYTFKFPSAPGSPLHLLPTCSPAPGSHLPHTIGMDFTFGKQCKIPACIQIPSKKSSKEPTLWM